MLRAALSQAKEKSTGDRETQQGAGHSEHHSDAASPIVPVYNDAKVLPVEIHHDLQDTLDLGLTLQDLPTRSQAFDRPAGLDNGPMMPGIVRPDRYGQGEKNREASSTTLTPTSSQPRTVQSADSAPEPHSEAPRVKDFGNLGLSSAIRSNCYPHTLQATQLSNIASPLHLTSTPWLEADHVPGNTIWWANQMFLDMRSRGRWLVQQGVDVATVMGDTCPTLSPFSLAPSNEDDIKFWTVSRWATRFMDTFPDLSHSDRLACWVVIFVAFQVRLLSRRTLTNLHLLTPTMYSGKYVPAPRHFAPCQIGTDRSRFKASFHTWHPWIY